MKFKSTLWLFAILAALALYFFLIDTPAEKKKKDEKELAEKVLALDPAAVDELTLNGKGQSITVKRKDKDAWEVVKPLTAKADKDAVTALLEQLKNARFSRAADDNPADLAVYGLKEPQLEISLKTGGQEKTLLVGDNAPIGGATFLKLKDQTRVLVSSLGKKDVSKTLYDLRDKTVLDFNTADIARITLEQNGKTFELTQTGKVWQVKDDSLQSKADGVEVESLINAARQARVKAFIGDGPQNPAAFGLEPPALRATFATAAGGVHSLLLGNQDANQLYFAKTAGSGGIFALDQSAVAALSKKALDLLDKTLLEFNADEATEIRLRVAEETILLQRASGKGNPWKLAKPVQEMADQATVRTLLLDLQGVRVDKYIDAAADEAHGLAAPTQEFTLVAAGKETSFSIGKDAAESGKVYARNPGQPLIFTLPKSALPKIFRRLHDLRDKRLLSLNTGDVAKIVIAGKDGKFELIRQGEDWRLTVPENVKKIKLLTVKDILWAAEHLEFEEMESADPGAGVTGLNEPALTVSLLNKDDAELDVVQVGKPIADKKRHYARAKSKPAVYQIPERFFNEIPRSLEKFRG